MTVLQDMPMFLINIQSQLLSKCRQNIFLRDQTMTSADIPDIGILQVGDSFGAESITFLEQITIHWKSLATLRWHTRNPGDNHAYNGTQRMRNEKDIYTLIPRDKLIDLEVCPKRKKKRLVLALGYLMKLLHPNRVHQVLLSY